MKNVESFIQYLTDEGKAANTIRNYSADIRKLIEYFEGGTPGGRGVDSPQKANSEFTRNFQISGHNEDTNDDTTETVPEYDWTVLTTKDIRAYLDDMQSEGLSVSTINRRLQSARTFFAYLKDEGIIEVNPAIGIKAKRIANQNETKWLHNHQVKQLFEAIDKVKQERKRVLYRAIFSVFVNSGLRANELADIKLTDIDWDSGLISVYGKGGKFRRVPFNPATQKNVKRWLEYRRDSGDYLFQSERSDKLSVRAIEHMAQNLSESLSYSFTIHQLRHTALKHIANSTGRIEIVASIAGHDSVETSRRYIEPSLHEIGEAMKKTEFDY